MFGVQFFGWSNNGSSASGGDISGSGTPGYIPVFSSSQVLGDSVINQTTSGNALTFTPGASASGAVTAFTFTNPANTNQTAGAEINGFKYVGGTRQWATGGISDPQREFYLSSTTYSAVGASVITNAYGFYAEAPTAGANMTFTNKWAAGFNGSIYVKTLTSLVNNYALKILDNSNNPLFYLHNSGQIEAGDLNNNLFIGDNSGLSITTDGFANTSCGVYALLNITTGDNNNAFGFQCMYSNLIGDNNNAVGYGALYSNLASDNNAFGYHTLYANTTGIYNNAFGGYALLSHVSGNSNNAFGFQALSLDVSGSNNDAFGFQALYRNISGVNNVAIGYGTLSNNSTGAQNASLGASSLFTNTTGDYNTAVGYGALSSNISAGNNTAVGGNSLVSSTGQQNSALGYGSGYSITTGTNNSFFGFQAGRNASQKVDAVNSMALGNGTYTTSDNQIILGNASIINVGIGTFLPSAKLHIVETIASSGSSVTFLAVQSNNTNQTLSTEIPGFKYVGGSRQWATGAITTQRETYFSTTTYTAVGASVITNAYGAYFEAPTASTNITITNNYALGLNGNLGLVTAGNGIRVKEGSNGRLGQTTLVLGTKAITITGITTGSRAIVTMVSPGGTTLTTSYQAVCTADTLTIQANVAAGTINTADTSVLNYFVFEQA